MGRTPAFCVALMSTGAVASRYAINVAANEERAVAAALAAVRTLPLWEVRSPVPDHTLTAFGSASKQLRGRPLVLDAGCGTGRSTRILGRTLGDADVLGIDRSAVRLSRGEKLKVPVNAIMVRADLVHFWRLAVQAGWIADYQFLFYPNPYPKPCQLKRRWYAHPAFPYFVTLGGRVEIRASWDAYLAEFRAAYCAVADVMGLRVDAGTVERVYEEENGILGSPVSNFERKYHRAGQETYRLVLETRSETARSSCVLAREDAINGRIPQDP